MTAKRRGDYLVLGSPFFFQLFAFLNTHLERVQNMAKINLKEGVDISRIELPMRKVLIAGYNAYKAINKTCTVTSGNEGRHSWGSLHYYGYALDLRTRHLDEDQKRYIRARLQAELGGKYYVLLEKTHLHVHWIPAKELDKDGFIKRHSFVCLP